MKVILFLAVILISWTQVALGDEPDCEPASRDCNAENCKLPDCSCADNEPNIPLDQRPQVREVEFPN